MTLGYSFCTSNVTLLVAQIPSLDKMDKMHEYDTPLFSYSIHNKIA